MSVMKIAEGGHLPILQRDGLADGRVHGFLDVGGMMLFVMVSFKTPNIDEHEIGNSIHLLHQFYKLFNDCSTYSKH